jgi:hypothetical protein
MTEGIGVSRSPLVPRALAAVAGMAHQLGRFGYFDIAPARVALAWNKVVTRAGPQTARIGRWCVLLAGGF